MGTAASGATAEAGAEPPANEPMIQVRNLTKVFGRRVDEALRRMERGESKDQIYAETRATVGVRDVSLDVTPGEVFVVMGLSGSGKSTLVRCLNRLIEPTQGRIRIGGEDITTLDDKALRRFRLDKISMVFQHFALFPHLNVVDNVAFGLRVRGMPKEERARRALEVLETVGLAEWAESRISNLSGGMKQRVGLARALATNPAVLLMDEPFSALDPLIRRDMQDELTRLQSRLAKTIVFITHDLDEALKLGDHIAVMKDGAIHQIGTPEEILRSPATDYVGEFVEGVNPWGIITARHIMDKASALTKRKEGPRVALRRMREKGISSAFIVDEDERLVGLLTADAAAEAIERGKMDFDEFILKGIETIPPDITLEELVPKGAVAKYPLPVLDDEGRMLGIVVRSAILDGLTLKHERSRQRGTGSEAG